jgi:RHS repeat-associated protein
VFHHQALPMDHQNGTYQNRWRTYIARHQRFAERDPLGFIDGLNTYAYISNHPLMGSDPQGLDGVGPWLFPNNPPPKPSSPSVKCFNPSVYQQCMTEQGCQGNYDECRDIGNTTFQACMDGADRFLNACLGSCTCCPPPDLGCAFTCSFCYLEYGIQQGACRAWIAGWIAGCEAQRGACEVGCVAGAVQNFPGTRCPDGWEPWSWWGR